MSAGPPSIRRSDDPVLGVDRSSRLRRCGPQLEGRGPASRPELEARLHCKRGLAPRSGSRGKGRREAARVMTTSVMTGSWSSLRRRLKKAAPRSRLGLPQSLRCRASTLPAGLPAGCLRCRQAYSSSSLGIIWVGVLARLASSCLPSIAPCSSTYWGGSDGCPSRVARRSRPSPLAPKHPAPQGLSVSGGPQGASSCPLHVSQREDSPQVAGSAANTHSPPVPSVQGGEARRSMWPRGALHPPQRAAAECARGPAKAVEARASYASTRSAVSLERRQPQTAAAPHHRPLAGR